MQAKMNQQVLLKSRPTGVPQAEHFEIVQTPIGDPKPGQVLIRLAYVSVDPAMRGWVNAAANYAEPVAIGAVMKSFAVGHIVKSADARWKEGDIVTGLFGWQQWALVDSSTIDRKVDPSMLGELSLSYTMGVLGLTGVTAYFGLLEVGQPRVGQTVVVSSGAGSVGSCVGQIAALAGCRTVAITTGARKLELATQTFGFDAAVDYKSDTFQADLKAACPAGVDVYFDNTAGHISDAVLQLLNLKARVVICGTIAHTEWVPPPVGPRVERQLLVTRSRMEGFIAPDYQHRWDEAYRWLAKWLQEGRLKVVEEVLDGLHQAAASIDGLYRGENLGKRIIRIEHSEA